MKKYIRILLLAIFPVFLTFDYYDGPALIGSDNWNLTPGIPYRYFLDHTVGINSLRASTDQYRITVKNGKIRNYEGEYYNNVQNWYGGIEEDIWIMFNGKPDETSHDTIIFEINGKFINDIYVTVLPRNQDIFNMEITGKEEYSHTDISMQNTAIQSGAQVTINGYNSVKLLTGFKAHLGSKVRVCSEIPPTTSKTYKADVDFEIESTDSISNTLDKAFINQNHPNPVHSYSTVSYYIPEYISKAYLQFTNFWGDKVYTITILDRGENELTIDTNNFSPGIYMYTLINDGEMVDTKQMIVSQ